MLLDDRRKECDRIALGESHLIGDFSSDSAEDPCKQLYLENRLSAEVLVRFVNDDLHGQWGGENFELSQCVASMLV